MTHRADATGSAFSLRTLHLLATILIVAGAALAILVALTGGGGVVLGGSRLSIRSPLRPLIAVAIGVALDMWVTRRRGADVARENGARFEPIARIVMATVLAVALGLALVWHVKACGGLDSYGYVSAASLLASGRLKQIDPLAAILPFDSAMRALAPLGYVVAPDGASIVPRFPLGFPLLMAPFSLVGRDTVFIVPLLCGVATVWVAYVFAREQDSALAGGLAATLVAVDPIFVNQAIQPMSDVPAAMWVLLASWLALRKSPRPMLSAACAGMAVLTRPVLLLAMAAIGVAMARTSRRELGGWMLVAAAFALALGTVQFVLFGRPWSSGYGSAEHLFQLARVPGNVTNFARWLAVVYGPATVALAIALVTLRRSAWIWISMAVAAGVVAPYLLYTRYDDWEATRFLLPASTLMLVVTACGVASLLRSRFSSNVTAILIAAIALGMGARSYVFLTNHGVQRVASHESKYPLVGNWFLAHTPSEAIVISSLHSGSIRYYSGRKTLRWDEIPPGQLAATIAALERAGHLCYLALDGSAEEDGFRLRFESELASLAFVPASPLRGFNIVSVHLRR